MLTRKSPFIDPKNIVTLCTFCGGTMLTWCVHCGQVTNIGNLTSPFRYLRAEQSSHSQTLDLWGPLQLDRVSEPTAGEYADFWGIPDC